jgi:hypothetical protein
VAEFLPFTRPTIDESTIDGVGEVFRSGWLATGPNVSKFEQALSDYVGGDRTVLAVTSGTGALELSLQACGIGPGDEVIVPAMTFAATANVVMHVGATPVLVDVDLFSRNILMEQVEAVITERTRAIMPVHFSGLPVDYESVYSFARKHDLRVIEDAAHAIGSAWGKIRVGGAGDLACFSFHPNKNMTTIEGGAISVPSEKEAEIIRNLRFHGIQRTADGTIDVTSPGGKYNLSDVAARVGIDQLARLDEFNNRRRFLAHRYLDTLAGAFEGLVLPERGDEGHSWHMCAILIPFNDLKLDRPGLITAMKDQDIGIGVHYPAVHELSLYQGMNPLPCPNASRIGHETITLPLFPTMQDSDVDRVCDSLLNTLNAART